MNSTLQRRLWICHIVVTAQLVAAATLIIFWSLLTAPVRWWAIFSLSAQGAVLAFLAALVYGFAVFRGTVGERTDAEYPFTSSTPYRVFYLLVPVLGGTAVGLDYLVAGGLVEGLRGWALGTVITSFTVWVFVDAIIGVVESTLPESRRLRAARRARQMERRSLGRREKLRQLEVLRAERKARTEAMRPLIREKARRLVDLLSESINDPERGLDEGAVIGFEIWRAGGTESMAELHRAAVDSCRERGLGFLSDYLDYWWDGVGGWKSRSPAYTK